MKKLIFLSFSLLSLILASCSSGTTPKTITTTSTEFTSGELAKYIEVVDEPSELTFAEKDGVIATQYIRLKVKLELVKDGIENVDARDIDFAGLFSVATINLIDENDVEVQDISIKSEELLKLKKLLTGKKGDTAVIVFEGEFHNSDDAPKWFKSAVKFTPHLTGDIITGTTESEESSFSESSSDEEDSDGFITISTDDEESTFDDNDDTFGSSSKSGAQNFDAILKSYEEYVDKYISLLKKANDGDMSAMTEYASFMAKAQKLSEQLENAHGDMTIEQWEKYNKITMKMLKALEKMK